MTNTVFLLSYTSLLTQAVFTFPSKIYSFCIPHNVHTIYFIIFNYFNGLKLLCATYYIRYSLSQLTQQPRDPPGVTSSAVTVVSMRTRKKSKRPTQNQTH